MIKNFKFTPRKKSKFIPRGVRNPISGMTFDEILAIQRYENHQREEIRNLRNSMGNSIDEALAIWLCRERWLEKMHNPRNPIN